jgi:hypothetical protein
LSKKISPIFLAKFFGLKDYYHFERKNKRMYRIYKVYIELSTQNLTICTATWVYITWEEQPCEFCNSKFNMYICSAFILSVVLFGCETMSFTLREECTLAVFENRVLRRIFGPKRDEVTGEWNKLPNEELNDLHCSPNIVRVIQPIKMRWAGHVACMREKRGVYKVLVGKLEGKKPLGRPRCRWEDSMKMGLKEVGCGVIDWIELGQGRDRWRALLNAVMNLRVP